MIQYLLDKNVVIAVLNTPNGPASQRVKHNLAIVESLQFEVLEFDPEDARYAGEIRAQLSQQGTPIGAYDVLIAGQARARDLTLVTRNTREFKRVAGLNIENWQLE